jgi:chorismate mutase
MYDGSTFQAPEPKHLSVVRTAIDRVDDGLVLLLAGGRRLAGLAARIKLRIGLPTTDTVREAEVRRRGALAIAAWCLASVANKRSVRQSRRPGIDLRQIGLRPSA